jgi:hypothetical protein
LNVGAHLLADINDERGGQRCRIWRRSGSPGSRRTDRRIEILFRRRMIIDRDRRGRQQRRAAAGEPPQCRLAFVRAIILRRERRD